MAAKEKEESSNNMNSSKVIAVLQYREAGGGAHRDLHPGLMEDLWPRTEHKSSVTDKAWGSPILTSQFLTYSCVERS